MRVSESAERASKEAETASMAAGRASEAARSRAWLEGPRDIWECLRGRVGRALEGKGAETIMKIKAKK